MQNQLLQDTMCANFQVKQTTLTFSAQICPKMDFGVGVLKTKSGCRISSSKIPCVPIFRQNKQLWLFRPKFAQKWILGSEFRKTKSGCRISSSKMSFVLIFRQNGHFWLFRPKFRNSKPGLESAPPIYHECRFLGKTENFEFST